VVEGIAVREEEGGHGGGTPKFPKGGKGGGAAIALVGVLVVGCGLYAAGTWLAAEVGRFDGYVEISPTTPIPIEGRGSVGLDRLTPADAEHALDGFHVSVASRVGDAALHRSGFAFRAEGSTSFWSPTQRGVAIGPAGRAGFGWFFTDSFGLFGSAGAGTSSLGGERISSFQYLLEADGYVPLARNLELGFYLAGGDHHRMQAVGPVSVVEHALEGGGGVLLELELTPRWAVGLRAGAAAVREREGTAMLGELALTMAIY
jgi:hypothetical protein